MRDNEAVGVAACGVKERANSGEKIYTQETFNENTDTHTERAKKGREKKKHASLHRTVS